jgi:hypothetical protein
MSISILICILWDASIVKLRKQTYRRYLAISTSLIPPVNKATV